MINELIDAYNDAGAKLAKAVGTPIGDLDDMRDQTWNGDDGFLVWDYDDEWMYAADQVRQRHEVEGLVFFYCRFNTGDQGWIVVDEKKKLDHAPW
jgi:hypothetical protein